MAIVSLSFDTADKKMSCSIDGAEIPNVVEAYWTRGEKGYRCNVVTMDEDSQNDIRKYTQIMAKEGLDVPKDALATNLPEFVAVQRVDTIRAEKERASAGLSDDFISEIDKLFS